MGELLGIERNDDRVDEEGAKRVEIGLPDIRHEVRLLGADLAESDEPLLATLQAIRAHIAEVAAELEVAEVAAVIPPQRERSLRLDHQPGRGLLRAREWRRA